jgi:hypothetical protein
MERFMQTHLFSRRDTQSAINRLSGIVSDHDLRVMVDDLNRPGRQRLTKIWEVVLLDALARVSPIRHEQPLPDGRKPDFAFDMAVDGRKVEVVGDITCVSDAGLDKENPVEYFKSELSRVAGKMGVDPDKLYTSVHGQTIGEYRDAKMVLSLPGKGETTTFIKRNVSSFLRAVSKDKASPASINLSFDGIGIAVAYNPSQTASLLHHPTYDVPYSIDRNPLAAALKDKADQLRKAPDDCIRLVVVCDGDCATLRQSGGMGTHFTAKAIVEDFLRKTSTLDAVLVLPIVETGYGASRQRFIDCLFRIRPPGGARPSLDQKTSHALINRLQSSLDLLPRPVLSAQNAGYRTHIEHLRYGPHGGLWSGGNRLKISSRQILEALAGLPSHGINRIDAPADAPPPPADWQAFFFGHLKRGQMITKVTVISGGDTDDDTLEFEFGPEDPAISPFRMPR